MSAPSRSRSDRSRHRTCRGTNRLDPVANLSLLLAFSYLSTRHPPGESPEMAAPVVLKTQQLPDLFSQLGLGGLDLGGSNIEHSRSVTVLRRSRKVSITAVIPFTTSSSPCAIHVGSLGSSDRPCSCSLSAILNGSTGHVASVEYLSQVAIPSQQATARNPLLVISLDGVVSARLPTHLMGGYTDVISRPYLKTLMKYLLLQKTPWCFVFYTSMTRSEGMKVLKELNRPTGGPEDDERDGVLGLFAKDDMRPGVHDSKWTGSGEMVKDLASMWQALYEEEGVQWGVHNTVVLSHDPSEMAKQPYNFIYVPRLDYKSSVRPQDDMFLLLVIAVLRNLENHTNFAYQIKAMTFNRPNVWTSNDEDSTQERNMMLYNAVKICAGERNSIKALIGNKRDAV
ncbi:hypothetical protein JCM16303_005430 [Sporobolomyces ruberrimus]